MKKTIVGIVGSIIILILCQVISQLLGSFVIVINLPDFMGNIIAAICYIVLVYAGLQIFSKKFLKIGLVDLGMPKFKIKFKWAIVAVVLPVVITSCYMMFPGQLFRNDNVPVATLSSAGIFYIGIAAGFVEEMVFRGVILNVLLQKTNKYVAIIVPSVLFGVLHIIGSDLSMGSSFLVIIAGTFVGVMFSLISLESHSVWNSGIVHALWNIIIASGIFQVSEKIETDVIYNYVLKTNEFYITGGDFGIESSLISVIGYIVIAMIAFVEIKRHGSLT